MFGVALKCIYKGVASLKTVITDRPDWAFASVSRAKHMKDVCDKVVASTAESWQRIGFIHKSLGATKACSV